MNNTPTSAEAPTVSQPRVDSFDVISRKLRFIGEGLRAG